MTHSDVEEHDSMSFYGEFSHGASDMTQTGHATYASLPETAAAAALSDAFEPAVMSNFAQEAALLLKAVNPDAYALWLQLEQMQHDLLAANILANSAQYLPHDSYFQAHDSPPPPTPANGSLAYARQVPQQYISSENVNNLCSLVEQATAVTAASGQNGFPGNGNHVEGRQPDRKQQPNLFHHSCVIRSPTLYYVCTHWAWSECDNCDHLHSLTKSQCCWMRCSLVCLWHVLTKFQSCRSHDTSWFTWCFCFIAAFESCCYTSAKLKFCP